MVGPVGMGFLGGGNSNSFGIFTPKLGEDFQFDSFFSNGLVQPPTSFFLARFAFLTVDPLRGVGKGFSLTLCFSFPKL